MYRPALTLTIHNAKTALDAGLRAIADGQTQFDLGDLSVVDSAAVATLLAWQRAAMTSGRTVVFSNLPASLQSLAALYGVTELLHLPSDQDARADLPHH
ncbi:MULTISPECIES: STAS domain-containing protein [Oxalobacteraceae]|jgi:phospholipid transport system transporter-binding protein|uniref:STAS domain-containing protein n=1 Tax=Oxalobacteraceae TaxID=75682 RepID=UPI0010A58643|nr:MULTISPECIES: STAS domain-containing protein [Oxalobacteraceae]